MNSIINSISAIIRSVASVGQVAAETIAKNTQIIEAITPIALQILGTVANTFKSPLLRKIAGTTVDTAFDILCVRALFQYIRYMRHSFSKETVDQDKLKMSIQDIVHKRLYRPGLAKEALGDSVIENTNMLFDKVMNESRSSFASMKQLNEIVRNVIKHNFDATLEVKESDIVVCKKERPKLEILSYACYALSTTGYLLVSVHKWNIVNLAKIAQSMGQASPIFMFVVNAGADTLIGIVTSAGIILALAKSTHRIVIHAKEYLESGENEAKRQKTWEELKDDFVDIAVSTAGLLYTLAPLVFVVNPPLVIGLALLAKGTGLYATLRKSGGRPKMLVDYSQFAQAPVAVQVQEGFLRRRYTQRENIFPFGNEDDSFDDNFLSSSESTSRSRSPTSPPDRDAAGTTTPPPQDPG